MQRRNKILLYTLFAFFLSSLLLAGCSQNLVTVAEDLSKATPLSPETSIAASGTSDSNAGSSFVKIVDEDTDDEESTQEQDVLSEEQEEDLDKRIYREGDLVTFDPVGVDPDGDLITYTYSKPLDEKGQWQTTIGDTGTYLVTITASDGKTEVEQKVILLILSANRAPALEGLEDMTVPEGTFVTLKPKIFDYNSDEITVMYSKPLDEEGTWQTDYDDSGTYLVKVSASDNQTTTEKQITITVTDANRAPILEDIPHISAYGGDLVTVTPKATDPDNDTITFVFSTPLEADGMWQTTDADVGTYAATVGASDGELTTEKVISIIVNHKNKAPVISVEDAINGEIRAEETQRVALKPTIVDPEGDSYSVTYSAPFDSEGIWVTDWDDAGEYTVTITATDDNGASSSLEVIVVIYDRNRAPVFKI